MMTATTRSRCFAAVTALALGAGCRPEVPAARDPFAVAGSLLAQRRFAQAHPHFRRLRDSLATTTDTAGYWKAQLWWAQTLMRLGRTDSSAEAIGLAMTLGASDSSRLGWTFWLRCGLSSRLGRFEGAISDCARARALAVAAGDGELEARIHFALGTIYSRRALYRQSVAETERALALERRFGRSPNQLAGVLNSMGVEYAAVGRLPEAAAAYEEGLARARALADTSTAGVVISNLAALRSYTGRLDLAIELMEESLRMAEAVGDSASIGYALNSLGDYHRRTGNRLEARERLRRSLAISPEQIPAVYRVIGLVNLGLVEASDGATDRALAVLTEALPLAERGGFGLERFEIHATLVNLAIGRRDRRGARDHAARAKRIADSLGSPDVEFRALELEGQVRELEARSDAAQAYLDAIELLESWRGRVALGDLRLGLAEPRWSVYERAIRTLLARGDTARSFEVSERARARRLLELVAERHPGATALPVALLKQRLRERSEERQAVGDSIGRLLDQEIAALTDSLAALEVTGAADPRGAARYPRPASLDQIRTALLSPGSAALYSVFWGDSAVYGWWITREGTRARRLGPADSLGAAVEFLREAMLRPGDSLWVGSAIRAHQRLVAPLVPGDGGGVIYAVVDGPLARVPIEALVPAIGARPLGATRPVVYGPSATILAALAATPGPTGWDRAALVVGNPRRTRASADPETPASPRGDPGAALPNAEQEAREIAALYQARGVDLLVGRRATVGRWMGQQPARYRYLHFAAHARADDREPDGSRLFLADGDLDLPTIRRLDLRAELVTLSACETALGRQVRGEGVMGLAQAFVAAGARRTLVTLWPVRDQSTAAFMTEFYRELSAGRSPGAALFEVRRRWIGAADDRSHPIHWAPFVLLGEPDPT